MPDTETDSAQSAAWANWTEYCNDLVILKTTQFNKCSKQQV